MATGSDKWDLTSSGRRAGLRDTWCLGGGAGLMGLGTGSGAGARRKARRRHLRGPAAAEQINKKQDKLAACIHRAMHRRQSRQCSNVIHISMVQPPTSTGRSSRTCRGSAITAATQQHVVRQQTLLHMPLTMHLLKPMPAWAHCKWHITMPAPLTAGTQRAIQEQWQIKSLTSSERRLGTCGA